MHQEQGREQIRVTTPEKPMKYIVNIRPGQWTTGHSPLSMYRKQDKINNLVKLSRFIFGGKWHKHNKRSKDTRISRKQILYPFETRIASKVLEQSTWNKLQEQLQEHSFQIMLFYFLFEIPGYLCKLLLEQSQNAILCGCNKLKRYLVKPLKIARSL